jgi:fibronectin-binding autotransporter adhesin
MSPFFRQNPSAATPSFEKLFSSIARLLALPFLITTAQAATWYWDSNGTGSGIQQASGTWNTTNSNWSTGSANVTWNNSAGNIAQFGTSSGAGPSSTSSRTVTISGTVNAAGLFLNSSASGYGYILTGGEVALAEGSTIEVARVVNTDLNRRHEIHSVISGKDINIIRSATGAASNLGMLRLHGTNTWTGTLTLSSSSASGLFVEAFSGAALNSLDAVAVGTDTIMVLSAAEDFSTNFSITGTGAGNRGALRFDADGGKISGNVTLTGDASITSLSSNITGTVSGVIGESGGARTLSITTGSIALSGANNHTGGTTLTGGILHINNAQALGTGTFTISGGSINNTSGTPVTVAGNVQAWNGNFTFTGANDLDLGIGNVILGGALETVRQVTVAANTLTVGGNISDGTTTGLTKAGAGNLVLGGNNTYTGATTVNAGTLVLTGGSTGGNEVAVAAGGTLGIRGDYTIATTTGNVTINGGTANHGGLSLVDGSVNSLTLTNGNLTVGGLGQDSSVLSFDIGDPGTSDRIITDTFTVNEGGAVINLSQLTGTALGAGTYTLLQHDTATGIDKLQVGSVPASPAGKVATVSLGGTAAETQFTVAFANASTTNTAYWTGTKSTWWNTFDGTTTNFAENADGTGATNILPDASTDVWFTADAANGNTTTSLGQDFSARSLHLTGSGNTHNIGGLSLLTIGSGGITVDAASGNHTISSRVGLGASQTWSLPGSSDQTLTVSGAITGSDLVLTGGRTVILSGENTYGGTVINNGIALRIGDGGGTGSLGTGSVTNEGSLTLNRTGNSTVANDISGSGDFTVSAGLVTVTGNNTYTGPTTINGGGTIVASSFNSVVGGTASSNLGAPTTVADGTISLGDGTRTGGLRYTGAGETTDRVINLASTTGATAIYQNGSGLLKFTSDLTTTGIGSKILNLRGGGSGEAEFAGIIGNTGDNDGNLSISKSDNGTWVLSAANTYTGTTTVGAGTLRLAGAGKLGAGTGGLIVNGGTLDLSSTSQTVGNLTGTGGSILNNAASTSSLLTVGNGNGTGGSFQGVLANGTGTLAFTKIGTGTTTFAGTAANTYTGLTTVSAGVLTLNKTAGVDAITGNILIDGGYLRFSANNQISDTASVTLTAGGFNTSATGSANGGLANLNETIGSLAVSGSGVYNQNGAASSVTVTGAASFTGGNGAFLFIGSGGSFSANSLAITDMSRTSGGGTTDYNTNSTNGFIVYGNNAAQSVVKVGAGGLSLAGTSSTNNIVLRGGVNGSRLSLDGDVTTTGAHASGIIRDTSGGSNGATLVELSATELGPVTRTFNVGGGGADLTVGANVAVTNGVSSSAGLTKTGAGTLTLNGANTYTGATTVSAGTLVVAGGGINSSTSLNVGNGTFRLGANHVVSDSATVTLGAGGIFETANFSDLLGALAVTGDSTISLTGTSVLRFGDSSASPWSGLLSISGWSGLEGGSGAERVIFGSTDSSLTADQLSRISFLNPAGFSPGNYGAAILASGEVVPLIPEPSTALLAIGGVCGLAFRRRK